MTEESRKLEEDLRNAFAELFPLCPRRDLPWAPCHIAGFLRSRIKSEIEQGTQAWTSGIVRVLCEVSRPKAHAVDMARIVVDEAKRFLSLREAMQRVLTEVGTIQAPFDGRVSIPAELLEQIKGLLAVHRPEETNG